MFKETIREEVWLRAYIAAMHKGTVIYSAEEAAKKCLDAFDREFGKQLDVEFSFPPPLNDDPTCG